MTEMRDNPRALYLTFDARYLDPTRELLPRVFAGCCQLHLFGPGYSSESVLAAGIDQYVERHGPFDFVIVDEFAIQDFDALEAKGALRFTNHAVRFDRSLMRMGRDYHDYMTRTTTPRIIALLQSDYYPWGRQRLDAIEAVADYMITWGDELILPRAAADQTSVTHPGSVNAVILEKWTDSYLDFVTRHRGRVISCPQFIDGAELCSTPLARRPDAWSVVGADYDARVVARTCLDGAVLQRSGKLLPMPFNIARRLGINIYGNAWSIHFLQSQFRRALRRSRYSYTCGSILHWPIRKYFELPANGCVLVGEQPHNFADLGFQDREHYVSCRPEDILEAHAWLSADPQRAQVIADNGRRLVAEFHSVEARSEQIGSALRRIMAGSFQGSRWIRGRHTLSGSQ